MKIVVISIMLICNCIIDIYKYEYVKTLFIL